jgi:hypothetical protein
MRTEVFKAIRVFAAIIAALALPAVPAASRAQHFVADSIIPERIVVKSTTFGATGINSLDTYLSGYEYTGGGVYLQHENFRDARTGNYRWKFQTMLNATLGYTTLGSNGQIVALGSYSWSGYHPFAVSSRLTLLAGAQIQAEGGALYVPSNGNNPVAVKLRTAIAASGMAIYRFPVMKNDWTARMQLDVPLMGVMFAPEFGQSYYEIFGLGHTRGIVAFTHPFNCPMWRQMLSLDIPLSWRHHSSTLRIAYTGDIYQSDINSIRSHIYRHAFSIGFVKTIFKIKQENIIKAYSPY